MTGGEQEPADGRRPAAIEMPKPTVWPMVLSLGLVLTGAGVALGTYAFLVIGGGLFFTGLWGWFRDLLPGRGHEFEPVTGPQPLAIRGRSGGVEQLRPGMAGYRFRLPEKVQPISAGLKGGLAGGLVMPIPALAWGVLTGHGLWFPVNLLAGLVLPGVDDLSVPELEQFRPVLLVIGLVIHVVMSATIGLIYGVLLPTIPGPVRWQLICGGFLVPLIWAGFSYGSMRIANPVLALYVDWFWFAVSQLIFGLTAAIVVVTSEKMIVPPAGSGSGEYPAVGPGEGTRR